MAASKIADEYAGDDYDNIGKRVETIIQQRVKEAFERGLSIRIDAFLQTEMERLISQEIAAVNIWGEKTGKPTTIRDCLAERARIFWEVKVNKDGREESYGGTPRFEQVMKKILQEQFTEAIKANAEAILSEFKKAVREDAVQTVTKHIDNLIKVK